MIVLTALVVGPIAAFWPYNNTNMSLDDRVSKAATSVAETIAYSTAAVLLTRGMLSVFPSL